MHGKNESYSWFEIHITLLHLCQANMSEDITPLSVGLLWHLLLELTELTRSPHCRQSPVRMTGERNANNIYSTQMGRGTSAIVFIHILLWPLFLRSHYHFRRNEYSFYLCRHNQGKKISTCQREANSQTILQCTTDQGVKLHNFSIVSIYLELIIWIS